MANGYMTITKHNDIRGNVERLDYEFEGGPYLLISYLLQDASVPPIAYPAEVGQRIAIGPYRFRVLEYQAWKDCFLLIRDKWPLWWLALGWHRINKIPDLIYRRTIITLAVWKLADYHDSTVPCIQDVHLVQRIKKWLTHILPNKK